MRTHGSGSASIRNDRALEQDRFGLNDLVSGAKRACRNVTLSHIVMATKVAMTAALHRIVTAFVCSWHLEQRTHHRRPVVTHMRVASLRARQVPRSAMRSMTASKRGLLLSPRSERSAEHPPEHPRSPIRTGPDTPRSPIFCSAAYFATLFRGCSEENHPSPWRHPGAEYAVAAKPCSARTAHEEIGRDT